MTTLGPRAPSPWPVAAPEEPVAAAAEPESVPVAEDPQFEVMAPGEHVEAPEPGPEDPIPSAHDAAGKTEKSEEAIGLEEMEKENQ